MRCVRTRRFVPTGVENIFGFRIDVALSSFGDQLYVFSRFRCRIVMQSKPAIRVPILLHCIPVHLLNHLAGGTR